MSLKILMGGGLDSEAAPTDSDGDYGDDDDSALAELASKYMQRFGDAVKSENWSDAYKAFCRLNELHDIEEKQERGY
jgi:hypothetical protein